MGCNHVFAETTQEGGSGSFQESIELHADILDRWIRDWANPKQHGLDKSPAIDLDSSLRSKHFPSSNVNTEILT